MSKSTSTTQTDKVNVRSLLGMGPHTVLIDTSATPGALADEISRRITQAQGVTHLLCGINLSEVAGELADNCISSTAWGLTEMLDEIKTLSDQLFQSRVQPASNNQVKHEPQEESMPKEAELQATSLDDTLHMQFGPDVRPSEIYDFISKRFAQLNASLMTFQSDLHLENEGGSSICFGSRLDALWGMLDCVQQVKAACREYNERVIGQETSP